MPVSGGCLYECLREAHLESYYSSFVRHGIIKCEGLASLSMHEYTRFGVLSMEDRVRLFKLVQIVKSVLADGLHCQHEYPTLRTNNVRTNMINNAQTLAQVQGERRYTTAVNEAPKAKSEGSRSQSITAVEYKPGSDTPLFRCRKVLTFSDSEEEEEPVAQDRRVQSPPKDVPETEVKQTSTNKTNTQSASVKDTKESLSDKAFVQEQGKVPIPKPPEVFFVDLESTSPVVKTQIERHLDTNISAVIDMDDKNDSGNNSASTNNRSALSSGKRTFASSERSGSRNLSFDLNQSDLSNFSSDSAGRRRPSSESGLYSRSLSSRSRSASPPKPCTSQSSYDLAQSNTGAQFDVLKSTAKTEGIEDMNVESPNSPVRPVSAFFTDEFTSKDHAYFPQFEPPKKFETRVETIVHNSDYNYGVPGSADSSPIATNSKLITDRKSINRKITRNREERIRVCVRKRPLLKKESKRQETDVVTTKDSDAVVVEESKVTIDLSKYIQKHVFLFDEVFDSSCSNYDVYDGTTKPLVQHVMRGGCGTCFAFGQTGAGKTFTLLGDKTTPGLYQLAAKDLFCAITAGHWKEDVHLWLSYYEIYCGQLYDLLNKRRRLTVRENGKQKVCIAGLMETEVKTFNNLIHAVEYGNNVRSIGNTGVNPKSSRSHAILTLEVRNKQDHLVGKLSFIDLAGSERASDVTEFNKQTRLEGAEINQSLLALKECIRSLDQQEQHTPYRQSKLTHILRDSFLGNSKTCMIANISPIQSACDNTLNTLRYADRVKELRRDQEKFSMPPVSDKKNKSLNLVEVGPSLFHPSTIQGSSTPKRKSLIPQQENHFDVNNAFNDANESPIRGHKLHKLSSKRRKESVNTGPELSPHKTNSASPSSTEINSGRYRSNSANRSNVNQNSNNQSEELRRTVSQENVTRTHRSRDTSNERPEFAWTHPGTSKTPNNQMPPPSNTANSNSAAGWSQGTHLNDKASATPNTQQEVNNKQSTGKMSKEDILQEHREILSHLDGIMFRARAAMTKSSALNADLSNIKDTSESGAQGSAERIPQRQQTHSAQTTQNPILLPDVRGAGNENSARTSLPCSTSESKESHQISPMADQLRLAQIRLRKQQQLLEIQQQQISAMNRESKIESGLNFLGNRDRNEAVPQASCVAQPQMKRNEIGLNSGSKNVERSPKTHPDDRKPKLSSTESTPAYIVAQRTPEQAAYKRSSGQESSKKTDELDKSLPPAEDFLKSLAEMKLNRQSSGSAGSSFSANGGSKLNTQQLAQLGEHFKNLGIDTRPFQDLLGSPSNTRDGNGTTFEPYERKVDVRRQLAYPERAQVTIVERRASADGEEMNNEQKPPARQASNTIASTMTAVTALLIAGKSTVQTLSQSGVTSQGSSFAPIEPHPVTALSRSAGLPSNVPSKEPVGKAIDRESLKLDLTGLVDDDTRDNNKRPKSSREYNRERSSGERRGRLINTARGRIERSMSPTESSTERAKYQFITAHEDQLAEITTICKQEMKLLVGVKMGDQSFDEYIRALRNVLSSKAQCVASLNAHIQELENMSTNGVSHK